GVGCYFACTTLKNALGYDDSLDVFGVHCVGGIIGAIATGILVPNICNNRLNLFVRDHLASRFLTNNLGKRLPQ
ncbi:MAG: ammonium transporter, partial [Ignavibacteria bacterium]|nr:ammonium transporter [Ignavibacteria bacterium]